MEKVFHAKKRKSEGAERLTIPSKTPKMVSVVSFETGV